MKKYILIFILILPIKVLYANENLHERFFSYKLITKNTLTFLNSQDLVDKQKDFSICLDKLTHPALSKELINTANDKKFDWKFWLQLITILILIRSIYESYFATRAKTYFEVYKIINDSDNTKEIDDLKKLIKSEGESKNDWLSNESACSMARNITNRYQIIAHMVERGFIIKSFFYENFSGTLLDVYDVCLPYIIKRRKESGRYIQNKSSNIELLYLRRDLERLALKSWLYQYSLCFKVPIKVIIGKNNQNENGDFFSVIDPDKTGKKTVRARIKYLKRKTLFISSLKMFFLK